VVVAHNCGEANDRAISVADRPAVDCHGRHYEALSSVVIPSEPDEFNSPGLQPRFELSRLASRLRVIGLDQIPSDDQHPRLHAREQGLEPVRRFSERMRGHDIP
jgi:hypothetical protein